MNLLNTPLPAVAIPVLAIGLFVGIWIAMVRLMRRLARMTDTVPASAGPRLDRSRWGNGNINGAQAKGCVRVERYATGLAVRMHPVFGNGLIWLPREQMEQSVEGTGHVVLTQGRHRIALFAELADFVCATPGRPAPTPRPPVDAASQPPQAKPLAMARRRGLSWTTVALWIAVLMLAYVGLRRWAPAAVAPLEAVFSQLT
jgi:hypothetical protein